nr:IS110 family transposase [Paraburkholderia caribensis]
MTVVAEPGDLVWCADAPRLMANLRLVPSENFSGKRERGGGITKVGNSHVQPRAHRSSVDRSLRRTVDGDTVPAHGAYGPVKSRGSLVPG